MKLEVIPFYKNKSYTTNKKIKLNYKSDYRINGRTILWIIKSWLQFIVPLIPIIRNKFVILQKIRTEPKVMEQIHQRQKQVNTATMPMETC